MKTKLTKLVLPFYHFPAKSSIINHILDSKHKSWNKIEHEEDIVRNPKKLVLQQNHFPIINHKYISF